ncbi:SRPBCC family protein [Saccharothrix australiensis]|uniref:Polyketide cyclase/dehydrase/lipid transport protein n=1 Tax=Saccharothrix australiensis TaxID=2072 RepID=A0A495VVB2_9PSEU|nr:SRPBCC family protein [Saccharothrix australiensis]RKT53299.1 polyketide cyclase/dehydrase/lipid transport protein [Saccharothrix australiensis]
MADESTQSIVIDAAPSEIVAVIADFDAYPAWANGMKRTEVLETRADGYAAQVKFNIDQGPIKDEYVLAYDEWSPRRISWHLVKGQMQKFQEGSYVFTERGGSTEVTYTLSVQLVVPMIGLFRRKAEKMIMDTALKELKRRVENAG